MKRLDSLQDGTPLVPLACKCSVWPCVPPALMRLRRCDECGVVPRRVPAWEELPEW